MYYSYVEIEYVATSFSPARTDLAVKLLSTTPPLPRIFASEALQKQTPKTCGMEDVVKSNVFLGKETQSLPLKRTKLLVVA